MWRPAKFRSAAAKADWHRHWIAQDIFLEAHFAIARNDLEAAFASFLKGAELGHLGAIHQVGLCYDGGFGVTANRQRAHTCFLIGAEKKHVSSCNSLARSYERTGFKERAKYWYAKAPKPPEVSLQTAKLYAESRSSRATREAKSLVVSALHAPTLDAHLRKELLALWSELSMRTDIMAQSRSASRQQGG